MRNPNQLHHTNGLQLDEGRQRWYDVNTAVSNSARESEVISMKKLISYIMIVKRGSRSPTTES